MGYQFNRKDSSVEKGLVRIACEQIDAALNTAHATGPLAPRIHTMRKSIKKLRGLIRLGRPGFAAFASENAALRDAGRGLSARREAAVNLATLDRLLENVNLATASVEKLRLALANPASSAPDDSMLTDFATAMTGLRKRTKSWSLASDGFDALSAGIELTWKRTRRDMAIALKTPTPEAIHEWRKRVKDHWYQARLLSPIWPEAMAPHVTTVDRLGEALGDHHDLAVLISAMQATEIKGLKPLVAAAYKRQSALIAAAKIDADRLFAESASCLVARWGAWWRVWRA